jgi:hypothetical protein
MKKPALQRYRLLAQMGFFALFTLTPVFDLLRYDLTEKHAYFLTYQWHLGIDDLIAGRVDARTAVVNLILYLFLPLLGAAALVIGIAWKWGRLYCGWLCPHFSVVETINRLMLIATGKHSVWDKKETPPWEPDGTPTPRDKRYWLAGRPCRPRLCLRLGGRWPDLSDAAVSGLSRAAHLLTLSRRSDFSFGGDDRADTGISLRPPPFLPLWLCGRDFSELRLDRKQESHGRWF